MENLITSFFLCSLVGCGKSCKYFAKKFIILSLQLYLALSYTNPVVDSNHPDPGVLRLSDGTGFAAVSTSDKVYSRSK